MKRIFKDHGIGSVSAKKVQGFPINGWFVLSGTHRGAGKDFTEIIKHFATCQGSFHEGALCSSGNTHFDSGLMKLSQKFFQMRLQLSFIAVEIIYNCYSTLDQFILGLFYTIVLNKIVSCLVETHSGDCFIQIRFRFNSLVSQVIFAYMIPG